MTANVGRPLRRREDFRFLTGRGRYVDDVKLPGTLHLGILRSPHAHAIITEVDLSAAKAAAGVRLALAGADLSGKIGNVKPNWVIPGTVVPDRPVLAVDRVRFVGECIALVVAETREAAYDALELIDVAYEVLPAVVEEGAAVANGAPQLHETVPNNITTYFKTGGGDYAAAAHQADQVLRLRLVNNRLIPTCLETRAVLAEPGVDGGLTVYLPSQVPHMHRRWIAETVGIPEHLLRVVAPDIGGGFGAKMHLYPEELLCAWLARELKSAVKWWESRSESHQATSHGRAHTELIEVAFRNDGCILGMKVETLGNVGAYLSNMASGGPTMAGSYGTGTYKIESFEAVAKVIVTNTVPVPYGSRSVIYDSGDYQGCLDKAVAAFDYTSRREEQQRLRAAGRYRGIGVAAYTEMCGMAPSRRLAANGFDRGGWESARIAIDSSGRATLYSGSMSQGHGHATALAQIAADTLQMPVENIDVVQGDTKQVQAGHGTFNSRSMPVGGSAAHVCAGRIVAKAKKIAAQMLEVAVEDIAFEDGRFCVVGTNIEPLPFGKVARMAYLGHVLPDGIEPGLDETLFYDPVGMGAPSGVHMAYVEVDPDTGMVEIIDYVAVDDAGTIINPLLARGQIHGGVVQGIGQALYEEARYDRDSGQLLTGSLLDYAVPHADTLPKIRSQFQQTPSPTNPLGVKGIGESGAIGAPPTIVHAVLDALAPFGIAHLDMPLTPQKVWSAIRDAHSSDGV